MQLNTGYLRWIAGGTVVLTALAVAWGLLYGLGGVLARLPGAQITALRIEGELHHLNRGALEKTAWQAVQGNLFNVDVAQVSNSLGRIAWVRSVNVRRQWPGQLTVSIEEHAPLAYWGEAALVNTLGERFVAPFTGELPRFNGPAGTEIDMMQRYRTYTAILRPTQRKVAVLGLSARWAWQIKLDSGLTLELGRSDMEARLDRFVAAYVRLPWLAEARGGYLDLRYPNGFAAKLAPSGKTASAHSAN